MRHVPTAGSLCSVSHATQRTSLVAKANTFVLLLLQVACGSISQYDAAPEERYGVKNLFNIVTKRILMQVRGH